MPLARNFLFKTQDKILAAGWNNKWSAGDWTFIGDVSYSKAKRNEQQYETNAQYRAADQRAAGTPRNIYDTGVLPISQRRHAARCTFNRNYADAANVQVGPTIYGAGYSKIPRVTDELTSGRIDVGRALDTAGSPTSCSA